MAEFGINAANLSGPSFSGSAPVAPVQQPVTATSLPIEAIGGLATAGIKYMAKADKSDPLNGYGRNLGKIAQAVDSGAMSRSEGLDRARAYSADLLASGGADDPDLASKISSIWDATFKTTTLGNAVRDEEEDAKIRQAQLEEARTRGLLDGFTNTSEEQKRYAAQLSASTIQLEARAKALKEEIDFKNSQESQRMSRGRYDMDVYQFESEQSVRLQAQEVLTTGYNALAASMQSISGQIAKGEIDFVSGQQQLSMFINKYKAENLGALLGDQRTASALTSLMDETLSAWGKANDPSTRSELVTSEFNSYMARLKLAMVTTDPKTAAIAGMSSLVGHTPFGEALITSQVNNMVVQAENGTGVFEIIGRGEAAVERGFYQTLQNAVRESKNPNTFNATGIKESAGRASNKALMSLARAGVDPTVTPKDMAEIAQYIASPEFKTLREEGQINNEIAASAKTVFTNVYQESVLKQAVPLLNLPVGLNGEKAYTMVDFEFTDGALKVASKVGEGSLRNYLSSGRIGELDNSIKNRREMKDFSRALNLLINAGSNLDGISREEYWEKNKSKLLPDFFPSPEREEQLKAQGYIGGNYRNPANYRRDNG